MFPTPKWPARLSQGLFWQSWVVTFTLHVFFTLAIRVAESVVERSGVRQSVCLVGMLTVTQQGQHATWPFRPNNKEDWVLTYLFKLLSSSRKTSWWLTWRGPSSFLQPRCRCRTVSSGPCSASAGRPPPVTLSQFNLANAFSHNSKKVNSQAERDVQGWDTRPDTLARRRQQSKIDDTPQQHS